MAPSTSLKIGIIGSGNMGRALGVRFSQLGHPILFGGRSPSSTQQLAAEHARKHSPNVSISHGTLDYVAQSADIVVWTLRERDPRTLLSGDGLASLSGKLILDLNNRDYAADVADKGGVKLFDRSLSEQLQSNLPDAYVVKAFNTIAMEALDTSPTRLREAGAQIFVAASGPSNVRALALQLVESLGFEPVDLGNGATPMRIAEALGDALRWLIIENKKGGRANLGLRMLPSPDLGIVGVRQASKYN